MSILAIAFDVFGTVFDLSKADCADVRSYADQLKSARCNGWAPLKLPNDWAWLPPHPDAVEGIARLRKQFAVVTLSNGPLPLLLAMSRVAGITWDAIIPLETAKVYKPQPEAYTFACNLMAMQPGEMLMVTANKTFGDLEGSASIGMPSLLIRDSNLPTIISLAESLGC